ncbi:MAG: DUF456 domain-containing protein [Candidatus Berkelbacteria bacterium]|nr:DUF456 domain-containing protein [Candidatus Berkelbacteria bacterium]
MCIGLLGIIIPGLPDIIFILIGALIYAIFSHFEKVGISLILIFGLLTAFSYLLDYLGTAYGAKKFGASRLGVFGAILGAILGFIFFNIIGFMIGTILGTALFEIVFAGKEYKKALKSGFGAFLGLFFSIFLKIIIAIIMIGLFISAVV